MCTVTYIPTKKDNFIFTSNRDEAPKRASLEIIESTFQMDGYSKSVKFPMDPQSNGTWIAVSNTGQLVCILNGAFEKHNRQPPYRLSRGIMALEFFKYNGAQDFFDQFEFKGMEPFTMVIIDEGILHDLKWDGEKTHIKILDNQQSHIWSSATLYPKEWQDKREAWFSSWLEKNGKSGEAILDFHKNGGEGNKEYDIVMNRNNIVQTVSITSVTKSNDELNLSFYDLT